MNQKSLLEVVDMNGMLQIRQSVNSYSGSNTVSILVTDKLAKGIYIVRLTAGSEVLNAKFVKQ